MRRTSHTSVNIFPPFYNATESDTAVRMEALPLPDGQIALRVWVETNGERSSKVVFYLPWTVGRVRQEFPNAKILEQDD